MKKEWNILYVRHNHEKAASRFLAAHGVDHYLPLYSEQAVWANRRRVIVEKPAFPGYLFVRFAPEQRQTVLMAPGVVCLTNGDGFGAIDAVEIARLRKAITRGDRHGFPRSLKPALSSMLRRNGARFPPL